MTSSFKICHINITKEMQLKESMHVFMHEPFEHVMN